MKIEGCVFIVTGGWVDAFVLLLQYLNTIYKSSASGLGESVVRSLIAQGAFVSVMTLYSSIH